MGTGLFVINFFYFEDSQILFTWKILGTVCKTLLSETF